MFQSILLSLAASVSLSAQDAEERVDPAELRDGDLEALSFLDRDPAEYALTSRCLPVNRRMRERVRLGDAVFEQRFIWGDLTGRDYSVMAQFKRSCDAIRFGAPAIPRCAGAVQIGTQICEVEELYIVPNEHAARALALRILVDEARENGADLPASNADAAQMLIDQSNSSR